MPLSRQQLVATRHDAALARAYLLEALPDEAQRRSCLALLADAIDLCHAARPSGWGLTLTTDGRLRLNFGWVELVIFKPGDCWRAICLAAAAGGDRALGAMLEQAPGAAWLRPLSAKFEGGRTFRTLPPVVDLRWTDARAARLAPHVLRQIGATIEAGLPQATGYPHKGAHSDSVVDAIGELLGRPVPQPGYLDRQRGRSPATARASLHDHALFLPLGRAHVDAGSYVYGARMVAAGQAFHDPRRTAPMPILFGDAETDSGRLHRWAILDEVRVEGGATRLRFSHQAALDDHDATELIKASDGKPVHRGVRRGFSLVKTPSFLDDLVPGAARPGAAAATGTLRPGAPATSGADFDDEVRRLRRLSP